MRSSFFLFIFLVILGSCIGKNSVVIKSKVAKATTSSSSITVSSVKILNNQIVLTGTNLNSVTTFVIKEGSTTTTLAIESQTSSSLTANTLSNVTLAAGKVFEFIVSSAIASATYTVDFSLCSSTLGGKAFDCTTTPNDKEVLSYDASSGKWKPRAVNGLSYQGVWDASSSLPTATAEGDYFIVSVASGSYAVGDWIVYNGSTFEKVSNSSAITSVFGRTGVVTATEGDYVLDKMGDVDFASATPTTNQFLKFNGTNWVGATLSSVETDPNVMAFAKTTLPTCNSGEILTGNGTALSCVTDATGSGSGSFTGTASRALVTNGSGSVAISNVTSTELGYVGGVTSAIQTQIDTKLASASFVDWSVAGVATLEPTRLNLTTTNMAVVTNGSGVPIASGVTATELGYVSNVTSAIQTQLNAKLATSTMATCGAGQVLTSTNGTSFSCVTDSTGTPGYSGTASMAVVTSAGGVLTTSAVTSAELGYVSGVTSAIQTQFTNVAATATALNSNKQATIGATTDLTANSLTTDSQAALILSPYNTAAGNTGELRFLELAANGTDYTGFKSPDGLSASLIYVLPTAVPTAGNVLSSDSSGVLSWTGNVATATKLATPATIDGMAFDGSANITVIAPATGTAAAKATPADTDLVPLVDSQASNVLKSLSWTTIKATLKTYFDTLYAASPKYAQISDTKASGTDGGTFTSGAWQTRVLQTEDYDPDNIVSISSDQFTLQAGTYLIEASAPANSVGRSQIVLYNVTDTANSLIGTSTYPTSSSATYSVLSESRVSGLVTIAAAKVFEIRHRCEATVNTNGFGIANGFGVSEIYTRVKITKLP